LDEIDNDVGIRRLVANSLVFIVRWIFANDFDGEICRPGAYKLPHIIALSDAVFEVRLDLRSQVFHIALLAQRTYLAIGPLLAGGSTA
jgi:hypothetical protein